MYAIAYGLETVLFLLALSIVFTVELQEDSPHAVRVQVVQHGSESESSGVWTHEWNEVDLRQRSAERMFN